MESEQIFTGVRDPNNILFVKDIITAMEEDQVIGPYLISMLNAGWGETRGFVAWAAKLLKPKNYLEIGTRRGWSLGMVAVAAPECELYCFDVWEPDYCNSPNPGPDFVAREMKKLGYQKEIHFFNGNSHQTVPEFFQKNPEMMFDLILVDGDHSDNGARDDLNNTMSRLNIGGILLFDDIVLNPNHGGHLDQVFRDIQQLYTNFEYHAYTVSEPGVGIAIRIK
jgi:predicted O-methyltransferase YrrM